MSTPGTRRRSNERFLIKDETDKNTKSERSSVLHDDILFQRIVRPVGDQLVIDISVNVPQARGKY